MGGLVGGWVVRWVVDVWVKDECVDGYMTI